VFSVHWSMVIIEARSIHRVSTCAAAMAAFILLSHRGLLGLAVHKSSHEAMRLGRRGAQ